MWIKLKEKVIDKIPKKDFYFPSNYTSHEMFRDMMDFLNYSAKIMGSDAFSTDFTPANSVFIFIVFYFTSLIIEHFYGIYCNRNNTIELIYVLITLPALPQTAIRMYSFMMRRDKLLDVFEQMNEFHLRYYTPVTRKVMEESVLRSCNLCLFLTMLIMCAGFIVAIYPVIFYIYSGKFNFNIGFLNYIYVKPFRRVNSSFWDQNSFH